MPIGELGMEAINTGVGMAIGAYNDNRQEVQQRKLQNLQIQGQKEMTDYNQAAALKMWHDTNYGPQVDELEKAGLNPALLYGKGGGGGATASVTPGTISGGKADQNPGEIQKQMEIGMQMKAQLELLKAQKENIEADTANKQADIPVKGAQVPNIQKDTELKTSNKEAIDLQNAYIAWLQGTDENGEPIANNSPAGQQKMSEVKTAALTATGTEIRNRLAEKDIKLDDAQINKMAADIMQRSQEIKIAKGQLDINKMLADFNTNWGNIIGKEAVQAVGSILSDLTRFIPKITTTETSRMHETPKGDYHTNERVTTKHN